MVRNVLAVLPEEAAESARVKMQDAAMKEAAATATRNRKYTYN